MEKLYREEDYMELDLESKNDITKTWEKHIQEKMQERLKTAKVLRIML